MTKQIECRLEIIPQRAAKRQATMSRPAKDKIARITRTLVLAHQIERAVRQNSLLDYAEIAIQLGVSRARVCQIVGLLRLAPAIQERVLCGDSSLLKHLAESPMRRIFFEADQARQLELFERTIERIRTNQKPNKYQSARSHRDSRVN